MSPQLYEHVLERLLAAGARDAFLVPVVMKKSRPATMLRVLAEPADRDRLAGIVFAETSTIGLRWTTWRRIVLPREERTVETPYGTVRVKVSRAPDGTLNVAPEFEDCRRLATERGVPLKLVHQAALVAASMREP
jgi:pyridinium-3,5-bisthiocarboxylic acid mononucleotide nickel chelatase